MITFDSSEIAQWADKPNAPANLPELVRRLILALKNLPAIAGWVARMWVSMECSMDLSRWAHWNRPTPATKQLSMQVEMPNWFLVSGKPMESAALCGSEILDTVAPLL